MSQSRRDGNCSALSWVMYLLAQLHSGLQHIVLYQLSGRHCRETLQAGKKGEVQVVDG